MKEVLTDHPILTSAHLLSNHDDPRRLCCSPHPRYAEKLGKACEVVLESGSLFVIDDQAPLCLQLNVDIVEISGSLQWRMSDFDKRLESLPVAPILDEPPRRFWDEVNTYQQRDGRQTSRAQLEPPSDVASASNCEVGGET